MVWKIYKCAYLHQIAPKIMSLLVSLVDDLHEKRTTESQDVRNFGSARAICNFHSCYNFALMLYEKCNRFEPNRRAQFLFRYIIKPQIWLLFEFGGGTMTPESTRSCTRDKNIYGRL